MHIVKMDLGIQTQFYSKVFELLRFNPIFNPRTFSLLVGVILLMQKKHFD